MAIWRAICATPPAALPGDDPSRRRRRPPCGGAPPAAYLSSPAPTADDEPPPRRASSCAASQPSHRAAIRGWPFLSRGWPFLHRRLDGDRDSGEETEAEAQLASTGAEPLTSCHRSSAVSACRSSTYPYPEVCRPQPSRAACRRRARALATGAGEDNGIDHNKHWLRFPYDSTFLRSHYLHPNPYHVSRPAGCARTPWPAAPRRPRPHARRADAAPPSSPPAAPPTRPRRRRRRCERSVARGNRGAVPPY
jgi:hypothetical protein